MPAEPSPAAAAVVPRRLFYWCHTTSRQSLETGIRRVTRRLAWALADQGIEVVPVGRDERSGLVEVIGRGSDAFESLLATPGGQAPLFVPELTADLVAIGLDPVAIGRSYGLRTVALVHDLIPIKLPEHYAAEALAAFVAYYEGFARVDLALATTAGVAGDLGRFLRDRGLRVPPVEVVPLPAQFGDHPRVDGRPPARRAGEPLKLVGVVSWERRKNLLRLLRAVEQAQRASPVAIELTLVGRRGLDPAFDAEVDALLAGAARVTVAGPLADTALAALIEAADATVYPSLEEGFGLPIGESLWLGRPCLCHHGSSMAEVAPGGGTVMIDMGDERCIADALVGLAADPGILGRLTEEIAGKPLTSWLDHAGAVAARLESSGLLGAAPYHFWPGGR